MNIVIVYDSRTGTTAKAAQAMGDLLTEGGHHCQVYTISQANPARVAAADLLMVGSWVQGLFIIRQHPTEGVMRFIEMMGDVHGKKTVVFCTYKLAIGKTLHQMMAALEQKGARVVGQFKFRGPVPNERFAAFVTTLA